MEFSVFTSQLQKATRVTKSAARAASSTPSSAKRNADASRKRLIARGPLTASEHNALDALNSYDGLGDGWIRTPRVTMRTSPRLPGYETYQALSSLYERGEVHYMRDEQNGIDYWKAA